MDDIEELEGREGAKVEYRENQGVDKGGCSGNQL